MGGAPAAGDRRGADRRRAPAAEPAAIVEARHAARPAHGAGHRCDDRRSGRARRSARRRSRSWAPVAALAEQLAWRSRAPLAGRTVAVTRARAQASELARAPATRSVPGRSRPRRSAIEPLPGPPLDPSPLRPRLPHEPQRGVARCSSGSPPAGATPARWPARGWRRSAPGTAAALAERGIAPTSCPSASWPRGSSGARAVPVASRPDRARAPGARRAPRRAARARGRGRRARAV